MKSIIGRLAFLSLASSILPLTAVETPQAQGPGTSHDLLQFLHHSGIAVSDPTLSSNAPVELTSARQDFKHITFDVSCHTLTPLQIGQEHFAKGLGMHANGNAVFKINAPYVRFMAKVGVDTNADTQGTKGSVTFAVKVDGKQVAATPIIKGGETAQAIDVPLNGARQLELIVTDGDDGYDYDQADWGDAQLVDKDGHAHYLSDAVNTLTGQGLLQQHAMPASFVYGGRPSATLLNTWAKEEKPPVEKGDRTIYETTWREPGDGLAATWHVEVFRHWPATEFRWIFTNEGKAAAKPLTQVEALDLSLPLENRGIQLIHSTGGLTGGMNDGDLGFAVNVTPLGDVQLSGNGGRSSDKDLPFFVVHAEQPDEGLFIGVGWSGQWQAQANYNGKELKVTTEMPSMDLALPPGERIISPSILLGTYKGPGSTGTNLMRRMLYAEYMPLLHGAKPLPPVSWNSWFILENGISETTLKAQADVAATEGIEYFCIDAGWFDGEFPNGVGNWTVDKKKFPNGLGPIGEYVEQKGMKLGLWFEPERVGDNTRLVREHPEWVHGNLVDLGNKDAREWIFNMLKGFIDEGHVHWIRWDFNTAPLDVWNKADAADQHGLTQIRHVMGLYELLDRVMKAYPDLLIEGCASGGRRIDLETIRRSHTFWKSDETANLQVMHFHETGGNVFLPGGLLNTNLLPVNTVYDIESIFGGPLGLRYDWTKLSEPEVKQVRTQIELYKQLRPMLDEDYYPLFPQHRDETGWIGWQFDAPSRGEGFIVVLHPKDSPYTSAKISLRGLEADATYDLEPTGGAAQARKGTGKELADGFSLEVPAEAAVIMRYKKAK